MDPSLVTINNIFLQYVEHIDHRGMTGNLTDMLLFLDTLAVPWDTVSPDAATHAGLIPNMPIPAFVISSEHQAVVAPIMNKLNTILMSLGW